MRRYIEIPMLLAAAVVIKLPTIAAYCIGRVLDRLAYGRRRG